MSEPTRKQIIEVAESAAALYEAEIARLQHELAEARACNESQAASTARLWDVLAPDYEGDKSIHEVAAKLMNEISEERKVKRQVTDKFADYCIERNALVTGLLTERAEKAEARARDFEQEFERHSTDRVRQREQIAILTAERKRLAHAIDPRSETDRLERSVESLEKWLEDERALAKKSLK